MGRRENPLDPDAGPVERFAEDLRTLRRQAGSPTYRAMAARAGYSVSTLSQAAAGTRLPPLPVVAAYARACGADPAEWARRWHQAVTELRHDLDDEQAGPYPGLAAFGTGDSDRFFGRERLVATLAEMARSRRFAAVFGASGSGKSSLLHAGLIPALAEDASQVATCTPGQHPMRHADHLKWAELAVVDQFEELYTLCADAAERDAFIDLLLTRPARAVIAVRADFFGRCAEHRGLAAALHENALLVGAMTREELREAIVRPAMAEGLTAERALTATVIEDVADQPGALPLMAHALRETWRHRQGNKLTLEAYRAIGGAHGAIARTAEDLHERLSTAQARLARRALLRLIQPGEQAEDTRRPATMAELNPEQDADIALVIETLAAARLITLHQDRAELTHEALITSWPRLRGWVDEGRDRLRVQRQLTDSTRIWQEHGRDPAVLYRGTRLSLAQRLLDDDDLTPAEHAFLTAGTARARRAARRRKLIAACLVVLSVFSLAAAGLAVRQASLADRRLQEATVRLIAQRAAGLRQSDPRLARQLSVAAWRIAPLPEARSQLIDSVASPVTGTFTDPDVTEMGLYTSALSRDGTRLATHVLGHVRVYDLSTGKATAAVRLADEITSMAWTPDGRTLALADARGIRLWPVSRPSPDTVRRPWGAVSGQGATDLEFSAGGRLLSTGHALWKLTGTAVEPVLPQRTAAVSSDDRLALVIPEGADGMIRVIDEDDPGSGPAPRPQLWDLRRHKPIRAAWMPRIAKDAAFSPDGRTVAIATADTIELADLRTGKNTASLDPSAEHIAFSPDGRFIVGTAEDGVHLWRTQDGARLFSAGTGWQADLTSPRAAQLSADNRTLWVPATPLGTMQRLDVSPFTRPLLLAPGAPNRIFTSDGRLLITLADDRLRVWDVATRTPLGPGRSLPRPQLEHGDTGSYTVAVSPDSRLLAVNHNTQPVVTLWHVATQTPAGSLPIGWDPPKAMVFSPDGRTLAITTDDEGLHLWNTATTQRIGTVPTGDLPIFSPDGRVLYLSGSSDSVTVDPATARVLPQTSRAHAQGDVIFSGTTAVSSDAYGRLTFWNPYPTTPAGMPAPATREANWVTLISGPPGDLFATFSDEREIRLWDWRTRRALGTAIPTHDGDAVLALTHDGLLISSTDGILRRIVLDPEQAVNRLCGSDGPLTARSWAAHIPELPYRVVC
ncbi:helix-turn-helix domain-containing protein [Nonomuraea typhae]|uniref:Helix-turn-helix domain-containing protein n=1 Tax=Nonomuraea typhae TaxID=2603600 RepID=A0ABW7Z1D8_9ACTN